MPSPSNSLRALLALGLAGGLACQNLGREEHPLSSNSVKIGFLGNLNNQVATEGRAAGAQLAVKEINAAGGVNGQLLELVVTADLPASPVLWGAKSLVDRGVVGIVGSATSSLTISTYNQVTGPAGIPLIAYSSTSASISSLPGAGDLVWRTVPSDSLQGRVLADQIWAAGIHSVGVIFRQDAYGSGLDQVFAARFQALGGTVPAEVGYPATKTSGFMPQLTQLFAGGVPEGVLILGLAMDTAAISRDLQVVDPLPRPQYFAGDAVFTTDLLRQGAPAIIEGMRGTSYAPPRNQPEFIRFSTALSSLTGQPPTPSAEGAYDAVYLMAFAMAAGGANTSLAIRQHLGAVSRPDGPSPVTVGPGDFAQGVAVIQAGGDLDYQGASGHLDFNATGDITQATYLWWKIQNGSFVILNTVNLPSAQGQTTQP